MTELPKVKIQRKSNPVIPLGGDALVANGASQESSSEADENTSSPTVSMVSVTSAADSSCRCPESKIITGVKSLFTQTTLHVCIFYCGSSTTYLSVHWSRIITFSPACPWWRIHDTMYRNTFIDWFVRRNSMEEQTPTTTVGLVSNILFLFTPFLLFHFSTCQQEGRASIL